MYTKTGWRWQKSGLRNGLEVFYEALGSHGFQAERHMDSSIYSETYNDSAFALLFLLLWFVRCTLISRTREHVKLGRQL